MQRCTPLKSLCWPFCWGLQLKIIEHQNGPTKHKNYPLILRVPNHTLLLSRLKICWLATATFRLHYLGYLPPPMNGETPWLFISLPWSLQLEASKFPLGLPVVPTRISPPNGPNVHPKKAKKLPHLFLLHCRKSVPKPPRATWILNRATPKPPHSRRRGFAHRGCSPGSFLWSKKTPQANTHGWFSPPGNTQTKNGKGETNRPFCHQFLGFRGRKTTAFPSPFRAEKSNLRRIRKWRSWFKKTNECDGDCKKTYPKLFRPKRWPLLLKVGQSPPKQGLFTPTKTAGAWFGFLGTNRTSSTFELQKSGQSWTPGHRFSPKEKTTEWKLNKLNPPSLKLT